MSERAPGEARHLLVNGAFRGQQVTGQQRYATEIAARLLETAGTREIGVAEFGGPFAGVFHRVGGLAGGRGAALVDWAGALTLGLRRRGERLLTMTSRGPIVARNHVVVVHDLFVLEHPEWYSRSYVASHAPVLRAQMASAEMIVCVSEPVARRVRDLVRGRVPVITAPNAPSDLFQPGLERPTSAAFGGLASGGYVLAVSSQDPRKNFARLIAAHQALPDEVRRRAPLVLVGGSSGIFARNDIAGDDRTIRLGYVDDDELARLYSHAGVVAFPSLDEGFGLPAVEALASGADVVVSDVPVMHWVCGEAATYVDPLDVASISEGLARALTSPTPGPLRTRRALAIRQRFSWESSARAITTAIASLDGTLPPARVTELHPASRKTTT